MALRTSHAALRDASSAQIPLAHSNTTLAFARVARHASSGEAAEAIVAFNCDGQPARMTLPVSEKMSGVSDGAEFYEPLLAAVSVVSGGALTLDLPPNGFRVLVRGDAR